MVYSIHSKAGKVTIVSIFLSLFVILAMFMLDIQHGGHIQRAVADVATTSVTVLNIPPQWTVQAVENPASTSTTPTNVGSAVTFQATGTDGNGENYYLVVCKTSGAPTPRKESEGGTPTCAGGAGNLWAVSTSTLSGTPAIASYTAQVTDTEQTYDWYAFICDANEGTPSCNALPSGNETNADNKMPFSVNHAPTFTAYWNDSPILPDGTVTWTATSSDADDDGGANDQVMLYVCTTSNFTAGVGCDDGTVATSSLSASDPTASATIDAPIQDADDYPAYGFIVDEHGLVSSGVFQGTNSPYEILNATPTVSNVSIHSTSTIILTVEQGETTGFTATFDVTDANSCVANGSTTPEITSADINVYRSGIGSSSCMAFGDYNPNNCYTGTRPTEVWNVVCTQNSGTCLGPTDDTVTWTCTYPLWYVADPTDNGAIASPHELENWLATALAVDNDGATSTLAEDTSGAELQQFLQFAVGTTSIAYGSYQPGFGNASTSRPTTLLATGNVGLDQWLAGDDMCPTYPVCSGNPTSTIPVDQQRYSLAIDAYGSGTQLSGAFVELETNQSKTTSTSSPTISTTYWGIFVPVALTLSGDYIGVNTILGVTAETVDW